MRDFSGLRSFASRLVTPRLAFWALAGLALLISHDLIFLVQLGAGEALARALRAAGHGYWGIASLLLAATALATGMAYALRLRRLGRRASALGARPATCHEPYLARLRHTWLPMLAVVVVAFLLQENVEHIGAHGHLIGFQALIGPEYPLALPVIGLVSFVAALLAAAIRAAERALLAAISAALSRLRAPIRIGRPPLDLVARPGLLVVTRAGRGPPSVLVTSY